MLVDCSRLFGYVSGMKGKVGEEGVEGGFEDQFSYENNARNKAWHEGRGECRALHMRGCHVAIVNPTFLPRYRILSALRDLIKRCYKILEMPVSTY